MTAKKPRRRTPAVLSRHAPVVTALIVAERQQGHEDVCEVRYKEINTRLGRIEKVAMTFAGALVVASVTVAWKLFEKLIEIQASILVAR